jgi:hypothetical protein
METNFSKKFSCLPVGRQAQKSNLGHQLAKEKERKVSLRQKDILKVRQRKERGTTLVMPAKGAWGPLTFSSS